jgi:hypothetical protein
VEIFVVITIACALLALLLPAVLAANGSAKNSTCAEHLQKLCTACLQFEQAHGFIPPSTSNGKRGFMAWILPHLDQSLAESYNYNAEWYDSTNQKAIQTQLPIFYCPDSPVESHLSKGITGNAAWTGACIDYGMVTALDQSTARYQGVLSAQKRMRGFVLTKTRFAEVTDGLSNTLLFMERAGFPDIWLCGKKVDPSVVGMTAGDTAKHSVWATPRIAIGVRGHTLDGLSSPGPYAVNRSNYKGAYSFHPKSAKIGMGDSSVRTLNEGIDIYVFYALCTIQGEEPLPATDSYGDAELPNRKSVVPVHGTIFAGGKPAAGAVVCFHPRSDAGSRAWRSFGAVKPDGTFSLTTYVASDGAPEDDYVVTIYWSDGDAEPRVGWDASALRPDLLKSRFATREYSPLRAKVGNGPVEYAPVDLNSSEVADAHEYLFSASNGRP